MPARVALGALIIKERLGLTDRETVETIRENPYLQYFIGLEEFTEKRPFDPSLMVEFRKRFGVDGMQQISQAIAIASVERQDNSDDEPAASTENSDAPENDNEPPGSASCGSANDVASPTDESQDSQPTTDVPPGSTLNQGRLISDATCAPADIRYPTDISLLNEAREKTELIIDRLHRPRIGKFKRPRTYRQKARLRFLSFTKRKKPSGKQVRAARRQQLGYLGRNLRVISRLLGEPDSLSLQCLGKRLYQALLVSHEVYRQQMEMHQSHSVRVDDRIISISQPHVRPIKRGKAGRDTEFGAKLTLSLVNGFSFVDRLSWDSYNEGQDLVGQIEKSVHVTR